MSVTKYRFAVRNGRDPAAAVGCMPLGSLGWSCEVQAWSSPTGEIVVLRVTGELDVLTQPRFEAQLDRVLAGMPGHLVVDLTGVAFCSVGGFALLAETGVTAAENGIGLAVTGLSPSLDRYAGLCWEHSLPVRYDTAESAVAALHGTPLTRCEPLNSGTDYQRRSS